MKKERYFKLGISLFAGIALLTTAVWANVDNANAYGRYKEGLKTLVFHKNYTMNIDGKVELDGKEMYSASVERKIDHTNPDNELESSRNIDKSTDVDGQVRESNSESYTFDGTTVNGYTPSASTGGEIDYYVNRHYSRSSSLSDNEKTMSRFITFAELIGDTLVGDLKNNFVLVESTGEYDKYIINIEGQQVPEFVNAGLVLMSSAVAENSNTYYETDENGNSTKRIKKDHGHDNPLAMFENDIVVKSASCEVTLDKQGRIINNNVKAILSGRDGNNGEHTLTIEGAADFSDYDTTVPDKIDLDSIKYNDGRIARTFEYDEKPEIAEYSENIEVNGGWKIAEPEINE